MKIAYFFILCVETNNLWIYSELLIESLKPDLSENPWIRSDLKISKEKVREPLSVLPIPMIIRPNVQFYSSAVLNCGH
jgi:hypothetical protein